MSAYTPAQTTEYPESDGMPMAENTLQFQWITTLVGGLDALFRDDPNVFVAGDLFWYPIEGNNKLRTVPDAQVIFGRPKGHRGSYLQWLEGEIAPQVVFEVLSPGNRFGELARKFAFYERFGVEEYYQFDPEAMRLEGWHRVGDQLVEIPDLSGWISPRCGIRFELAEGDVRIIRPDGRLFESYAELERRAEEERRRAEEEHDRAQRLADKLRALGIDPAA
jgi:Uma2 family endonuclease